MTATSALLDQTPADRTAAESIFIVPSRTHPFVDYETNVSASKCSCKARRGTCWHLKAASAAERLGVTVREVLRRLKRAKDLGGCAKYDCRWCLRERRWPCPALPAARAYLSAVEANRQIEAQ